MRRSRFDPRSSGTAKTFGTILKGVCMLLPGTAAAAGEVAAGGVPAHQGWGVFLREPSPEELAVAMAMLNEVGPRAEAGELVESENVQRSAGCTLCDADAVPSLETALPTAWTQWGDAFFDRPDAAAGRWLQDQGCFFIAVCAGVTNPGNRFRMPLAFDYTANLPSFKVCGFLSNFDAPNDPLNLSGISPFTVAPDPSGNTFTPSNAAACAALGASPPSMSGAQRDQDMIRIRVPAGGIDNFRLFVTAAQEFSVLLFCNKNFPAPGDINSCWQNPANPGGPLTEFGYIATFNGDMGMTNPGIPQQNGPEGAINSTWAFPRSGPVNLPEGTYLVAIQLKQYANLQPPSTPAPPSTCYQIQVAGQFPPPPCACFFDLDGTDCAVTVSDLTIFLAQFGRTCAQVAPARCADINGDAVVNLVDLTALLAQFGRQGVTQPGSCL